MNEIDKGIRARQLLEDELLVESFKRIEESYMTQWKNSPVRDTEGREKIFMAIQQLEQVKTDLQNVVDTGKMAEKALEG